MHRHFHLRSQRCIWAASLCVCACDSLVLVDRPACGRPCILRIAIHTDLRTSNANRISFDGSNASLSHEGGATTQGLGAQNLAAHSTELNGEMVLVCIVQNSLTRIPPHLAALHRFSFFTRKNRQKNIRKSKNHFCSLSTFESRQQKPEPIRSDCNAANELIAEHLENRLRNASRNKNFVRINARVPAAVRWAQQITPNRQLEHTNQTKPERAIEQLMHENNVRTNRINKLRNLPEFEMKYMDGSAVANIAGQRQKRIGWHLPVPRCAHTFTHPRARRPLRRQHCCLVVIPFEQYAKKQIARARWVPSNDFCCVVKSQQQQQQRQHRLICVCVCSCVKVFGTGRKEKMIASAHQWPFGQFPIYTTDTFNRMLEKRRRRK